MKKTEVRNLVKTVSSQASPNTNTYSTVYLFSYKSLTCFTGQGSNTPAANRLGLLLLKLLQIKFTFLPVLCLTLPESNARTLQYVVSLAPFKVLYSSCRQLVVAKAMRVSTLFLQVLVREPLCLLFYYFLMSLVDNSGIKGT